MVTYLDGLLPIKSHDPLITLSSEITGRNKTISTATVLFATKLARNRMMTYLEAFLTIKSKSHKDFDYGVLQRRVINKIMSLLPECLWQPNLVG